MRANENKMEKSFLHFKATHPDWQPDPSSSIFLDKLVGMHRDALHAHHSPGLGLSGSIYAGGRGLGIGPATGAITTAGYGHGYGYEDYKLRERSRSYDRAWAKSSHLLRQPGQDEQREREKRLGLETMREDDEVDEAERMGWHAKVGNGNDNGEVEERDDEGEGFLRDVGVVGLLQQIMNR
jgi:autophagy-related protein 9